MSSGSSSPGGLVISLGEDEFELDFAESGTKEPSPVPVVEEEVQEEHTGSPKESKVDKTCKKKLARTDVPTQPPPPTPIEEEIQVVMEKKSKSTRGSAKGRGRGKGGTSRGRNSASGTSTAPAPSSQVASTGAASVAPGPPEPSDEDKYLAWIREFFGSPDRCMWRKFLITVKHAEWLAPVTYFPHAPFANNWQDLAKYQSYYIELPNGTYYKEDGKEKPIYWVGQIKGIVGYKALVYYYPVPPLGTAAETNGDTPQQTFSTWISFCSRVPKPMGSAFLNGGLLLPPRQMLHPSPENPGPIVDATYRQLLFPKEGSPVLSLPFSFEAQVEKELERCNSRFNVGDIVEVLDKNDCSQYVIGEILHKVGDRLFVQFIPEAEKYEDRGFWYSQNSHYINKLGWCNAVGAKLTNINYPNVYFPELQTAEDLRIPLVPTKIKIKQQMIFEMRHPCIPGKMCLGYVINVLNHGYIVAGTDWTRKSTHTEVVLHVTSDYIQPLGFCSTHKIELEYPVDHESGSSQKKSKSDGSADTAEGEDNSTTFTELPPGFTWERYLARNNLVALDNRSTAFTKRDNPFTRGCKLEATMVVSPSSFRPATVLKVAGRLMQIHFDEFERNKKFAYQWVSCDSSSIYPAGYAEMTGHHHKGAADIPRKRDQFVLNSLSRLSINK